MNQAGRSTFIVHHSSFVGTKHGSGIKTMGARRKARELALQMLFQHDMSGNEPDMIVTTFEDLQKSKPNTREFAVRIFRGTVDHLSDIDEMIQAQAENWRLSRMAVVDRNI